MAESNAPVPPDRRIEFRIGINRRRHRRRGRRHLRRRRQRRGAARRLGRAGRHLRLGPRSGGCGGPPRPRLRGHGRAGAQEHRAPGSGIPSANGRRLGTRACATPALPLPDKPSIAVLPFANMSGDPEQEYFADGMVEEIITALSQHPLAVRHRPQFDLHLQGPRRRREAGRARARRALCPRRLGAQGGQRGCASPGS